MNRKSSCGYATHFLISTLTLSLQPRHFCFFCINTWIGLKKAPISNNFWAVQLRLVLGWFFGFEPQKWSKRQSFKKYLAIDLFGQIGIKKKEKPKVQADQKNQKKISKSFITFLDESGQIRPFSVHTTILMMNLIKIRNKYMIVLFEAEAVIYKQVSNKKR
jgi:hypothetical protein